MYDAIVAADTYLVSLYFIAIIIFTNCSSLLLPWIFIE
jgi:hypothetical protein